MLCGLKIEGHGLFCGCSMQASDKSIVIRRVFLRKFEIRCDDILFFTCYEKKTSFNLLIFRSCVGVQYLNPQREKEFVHLYLFRIKPLMDLAERKHIPVITREIPNRSEFGITRP
jgi:hypothetical protein